MSHFAYDPTVQHRQSNGLGLAGFICSLVGFVLGVLTGVGGLLCFVGLIMSLIALGRQPRGFAVAGVILGLLGCCAGILILLFLGLGILTLIGVGAAFVMTEGEQIEITSDMIRITTAIQQYQQENRVLPASLDVLNLETSAILDPWGNRYQYHFSEDSELEFDLISPGKDGMPGSEDDIHLTKLDEAWDLAWEDFMRRMEEGDFSAEKPTGEQE